jgi:hypothetical protein
VTAVAVTVLILLILFVDIAQKKHLSDLDRDISTNSAQLAGNTNLNEILTIQNQIATLPSLENQTPVVSRLFGYIAQVTPAQATVSTLTADFTQNNIEINGAANSLETVNDYIDTLKFTTYKTATSSGTLAFSNVILASFGGGNKTSNEPETYAISLTFDPTLFSPTSNVTLVVPPNFTTTRSVLDQPTALFQKNQNSSSKSSSDSSGSGG